MEINSEKFQISLVRFWILDFRLSEIESKRCIRNRSIMLFSVNPKSAIENLKSFDDSIRPRQHVRRDRQPDLLGSFEINHELELHGLLHRKIGGLGTFENLGHIYCGAAVQVSNAGSIGHETTGDCKGTQPINRQQPGPNCKVRNATSVSR